MSLSNPTHVRKNDGGDISVDCSAVGGSVFWAVRTGSPYKLADKDEIMSPQDPTTIASGVTPSIIGKITESFSGLTEYTQVYIGWAFDDQVVVDPGDQSLLSELGFLAYVRLGGQNVMFDDAGYGHLMSGLQPTHNGADYNGSVYTGDGSSQGLLLQSMDNGNICTQPTDFMHDDWDDQGATKTLSAESAIIAGLTPVDVADTTEDRTHYIQDFRASATLDERMVWTYIMKPQAHEWLKLRNGTRWCNFNTTLNTIGNQSATGNHVASITDLADGWKMLQWQWDGDSNDFEVRLNNTDYPGSSISYPGTGAVCHTVIFSDIRLSSVKQQLMTDNAASNADILQQTNLSGNTTLPDWPIRNNCCGQIVINTETRQPWNIQDDGNVGFVMTIGDLNNCYAILVNESENRVQLSKRCNGSVPWVAVDRPAAAGRWDIRWRCTDTEGIQIYCNGEEDTEAVMPESLGDFTADVNKIRLGTNWGGGQGGCFVVEHLRLYGEAKTWAEVKGWT